MAPTSAAFGGSIVVVLGAAGALGTALVDAVGADAALVWAVDRAPVERMLPRHVRTARCDLTDSVDVDALADDVLASAAGRPFVIFQAAGGIGAHHPGLGAAPPATWASVYATYVIGPAQLIRRLYPQLQPGSAVVFVTSVNHAVASPWPHYATSCAAVVKLVEELAIELAPLDVRVNAVAPARFGPPGAVRSNPHVPLGATDVPLEAVVHACLFLADGARSPATTGVVLRVDGGLALDHARMRDLRGPRPPTL